MPNRKKIAPLDGPGGHKIWTFNATRGGWELHRLPAVNPINIAAGGFTVHAAGVMLPMVPQYVLIGFGVALSVLLRGRLAAFVMASSNVVVVPVIIRFVPDGAAHLERIDYANLGPVLTMVACLASAELLRVLYGRWSWNLCIPVPLVPKAAQPV